MVTPDPILDMYKKQVVVLSEDHKKMQASLKRNQFIGYVAIFLLTVILTLTLLSNKLLIDHTWRCPIWTINQPIK